MKRHVQNSLIAFVSLVALLACGLPTPGNDNTTAATPSNQPATQQTAPTPTTAPTTQTFEMPTGRLLTRTGTDYHSLQWHIVNLPDQTVEPFPALDAGASDYVGYASLSTDFAHLAFTREVGTGIPTSGTLYVLDLSTGVPTKVASDNDSTVAWGNVNWSQDGQWLSYIGDSGYDLRPFAYNLPAGNLMKLQAAEVNSSSFGHAVSPNGDRLVYVCEYCTEFGLYMIDTQGTNQRFLLEGLYSFIVWHPDGTRLYLAELLGNSMVPHVFSYDLATGIKTEIPDADYSFYPLMLSPNGKLLAYNDSKRGLAFINTEDDSILPVSFGSISLGGWWSPDSRYICSFSNAGRYTYILDVQTGTRGQIDLGLPDSDVVGWLP